MQLHGVEASYKTPSPISIPNITIRLATLLDLPILADIEKSAGVLFLKDPTLAHLADGPTIPAEYLSGLISSSHVWIACVSDTQRSPCAPTPVGFLAGRPLDDDIFFICEISVSAQYQRQGIGSILLSRVYQVVKAEGFGKLSLTTYRDLVWNGPWYTRKGFVEIEADSLGPEHVEVVEREHRAGLDSKRRCCMVKALR